MKQAVLLSENYATKTEQQLSVNGVSFWTTSVNVHKDDIELITRLKQDFFWEACLWGEMITLVRFGRI